MSAQKLKPCKLAARHSWTHERDVTVTNVTKGPLGTRASFSLRGFYKCLCGVTKYGQAKGGL